MFNRKMAICVLVLILMGIAFSRGNRNQDSLLNLFLQASPSENIVVIGDIYVTSEKLSFEIKNITEIKYIWGESAWVLAKHIRGRWRTVPFTGSDLFMSDVGVFLNANETQVHDFDFTRFYNGLEPGRYLFIRRFVPVGAYRFEYLFVEFILE